MFIGAALQIKNYYFPTNPLKDTDYYDQLYLLHSDGNGIMYFAGNKPNDGTELEPGVISQYRMDICIQNFMNRYHDAIMYLIEKGHECAVRFVVI